MATFVLNQPDRFPAGTNVGIYVRWTDIPVGPPVGPQVTSASVQANGSVSFSGLSYETAYLAHAVVNGLHAYMGFTTDPPPVVDGGGGGGAATGNFVLTTNVDLSVAGTTDPDPTNHSVHVAINVDPVTGELDDIYVYPGAP